MASNKKGSAEHIGGTRDNAADKGAVQHRDGTKTAAAHELWDGMHKKDKNASRSECIQAAVDKAGMTNASAATLYQNWRDEHGMVDHDNPGGAAANAQANARGNGASASNRSQGASGRKK